MPSTWARQPDEPPAAYQAFLAYLHGGPERTIIDAYRQTTGRAKAARLPGTWNLWSQRFGWVVRATAYDDMLEAKRQAGIARAYVQQGELWARRRLARAEQIFEDSEVYRQKAMQLAAFPVARRKVEGGHTTIEPVNPAALERGSLILERAWKLGREAIGEALGEVQQKEGALANATDREIDPADAEAIRDALRASRAKRLGIVLPDDLEEG